VSGGLLGALLVGWGWGLGGFVPLFGCSGVGGVDLCLFFSVGDRSALGWGSVVLVCWA